VKSCSPCVIWTRSYRFVIASWKTKEENSATVKYWEMIADKLSKAGWTWGCVSSVVAVKKRGNELRRTRNHTGT
jgi:hypothetical protein